jgi:hypothetical protein
VSRTVIEIHHANQALNRNRQIKARMSFPGELPESRYHQVLGDNVIESGGQEDTAQYLLTTSTHLSLGGFFLGLQKSSARHASRLSVM